MPVAGVYNMDGEKVSETELADEVFAFPVKGHVLHETVRMQLTNRRSGSAATKGRSQVRGGGQKPYRQKGTGRARAGSRRSPLWRGGGVVFGPQPRDYSYKVPKKVRKQALKMALTAKLQEEALIVMEHFNLEMAKTKGFVRVMAALNAEEALIITDGKNENLELSSRNVPHFKVLRSQGLNVYDVLRYEKVILIESSVKQITERLLS